MLTDLIATNWFELDAIADALAITQATLLDYVSEAESIPVERQRCLALFVIENVPALSRRALRLHGQVSAALAFADRVTATH